MKNKVSNLYHTLFQSRESQRDETLIRNFIETSQRKSDNPYDIEVVDRYFQNPQFIENEIIGYILKMENIKLDMDILQIQGRDQVIGVHNSQDILDMITLPRNIVDLAMDCYWAAWSFTIGHELYHLITEDKTEAIQEEYDADTFGYRVLLHLIKAQKEGNMPNEIRAFYENVYLAPIMLFEYFSLLDGYLGSIGKNVAYSDHPAPENRQELIFDMFGDVPEDFDTEEGNEVLNIFLDSVDFLKSEKVVLEYSSDKFGI